MNISQTIRRLRRLMCAAALVGLAMLGLSGIGSAATPDQAPPVPPNQSRVWFLRQLLPGENFHPPMLYVDGAPIGTIAPGTTFYRDLPPGRYAFTVENCIPTPRTGQVMTLQPNTQYLLQVQQDDNGGWDCVPPQVSYLRQAQPQQVPYLFGQVQYSGAR